jgi:hypothetical protein
MIKNNLGTTVLFYPAMVSRSSNFARISCNNEISSQSGGGKRKISCQRLGVLV